MQIDSEQFATYPELFYLGLDITLREVLYVGQLEVHLSQPNQDAVSGRLKLLSLADEVLREQREKTECFLHISEFDMLILLNPKTQTLHSDASPNVANLSHSLPSVRACYLEPA